jgi:hypothetical protein
VVPVLLRLDSKRLEEKKVKKSLLPRVFWWLVYNTFNMHDKQYSTRRLSDWRWVPMSRFGYVVGWLFWVTILVVIVSLILSYAR